MTKFLQNAKLLYTFHEKRLSAVTLCGEVLLLMEAGRLGGCDGKSV